MPSLVEHRTLRGQANDYLNRYVHTHESPAIHVPGQQETVEAYPKLDRLLKRKQEHNSLFFTKPYGCRVNPDQMVLTIRQWISEYNLCFDTIMIGSLTENQFILPVLTQLPLEKLCVKPGFLYIWGSGHKLNELTSLIEGKTPNSWSKSFRRSEELVFTETLDNSSPYMNTDDSLLRRKQWHCSMCITGTVKRDVDGHLINCNINLDLKVEDEGEKAFPSSVPDSIYKIAENFASGNRRLHIIPSKTGSDVPVRMRRGWVIMSPDVLLDNFDPRAYMEEIDYRGYNVPPDPEIESLRPKSPVYKKRHM